VNTHSNSCLKCGYVLEDRTQSLCFPCLIADAKTKMGVSPALQQTLRLKKTLNKEKPKKKPRSAEGNSHPLNEKSVKSKKAVPPELNKNKTHLVPKNWEPAPVARGEKRQTRLKCPLCNKDLPEAEVLMHIRSEHKNELFRRAQKRVQSKGVWVTFFQGGLPGLGKRR
jgi:hypothetical protein